MLILELLYLNSIKYFYKSVLTGEIVNKMGIRNEII